MMGGQAKKRVIALRPVYTDVGDVTEVYYEGGGQEIRNRPVKSEIQVMARAFAVDLKVQKKTIGEMVARKALVPMILGDQVFVPFKMRRPKAASDYCYGCVDVLQIDEIVEDGKGCRVRLKDGRELPLMTGRDVALNRFADGMKVVRLKESPRDRRRDDHDILYRMVIETVKLAEMIRDIHRQVTKGGDFSPLA